MLEKNVLLDGKTILITGAAGFIGSHLVLDLLGRLRGARLVGLDNLNDYYDVRLKASRLERLAEAARENPGRNTWTFLRGGIEDRTAVEEAFHDFRPQVVVNLAAQAGVRYSIDHPEAYIESNLVGFFNILEACRHHGVEHLVYASSSSVYGANRKVPYSVEDKVDHPVSLYAATKKSNELLAHAYSKLYGIPSTGLRFFTVYGPWGRPDMAYFKFTETLLAGGVISIFNYGHCKRDFTYVDDIVKGVHRVMESAPVTQVESGDPLPQAPYRIYNIGNSAPENLLDFVRILSEELVCHGVLPRDYDFDAHTRLVPMQPGDVVETFADTSALERDFGFCPSTPLREGLSRFAQWYRTYRNS